jgi:hypothetical protein
MRAPASFLALVSFFVSLFLALPQGRAATDEDAIALVHPIFAQLPEQAENDVTRKAFAAAAVRYKLQPLEVIDVPAPPPPRTTTETLKLSIVKTIKLSFDEAQAELDAAAAEVAATGGAGLSTADLSDLYLYRGMATARASWKSPAAPESANEARTRAFADYVRAAILTPDRALNPRELPPQVVADFARAVEEARRRPLKTLTVRGDVDAEVSFDGAAPIPVRGGVTIHDVKFGEHLLAVTELGRAPWGKQFTVDQDSGDETIPPRPALGLDDAVAADHARRMGARFALVAERKPGPGATLELRLIDLTGKQRDGALLSTTGDERGTIDAAVMRLDEQARRIVQLELGAGVVAPPVVATPAPPGTILLAPPRKRATFQEDPAAWARDRWPLLTAVGVVVGAAVVLGIAASH